MIERLGPRQEEPLEDAKGHHYKVGEVASTLGAMALADHVRRGGTVKVPSLGIEITSADLPQVEP